MTTDAPMRLCVLGSGSGGNCSVLRFSHGRGVLIDAGLSVRRTLRGLRALGMTLDDIDDVIVSHLDRDHWAPPWNTLLPARITVWMHRSHVRRAERENSLPRRTEPFDDEFRLNSGAAVRVMRAAHDELGSCVLRVTHLGASLGFATDLGRVTDAIVDHLRGVDVLAIESNYCPQLQAASARPEFVKRRVTGGSGHLSNAESRRAAERIGPCAHVVLLHLSRQCNRPELAIAPHRGASYTLTLSAQDAPTEWIYVRARVSAAPLAETLF